MHTPETLYPRTPDEMTLLAVPVKSLLNRLPETWGEFDFESLSALEQRSLQLLTAGGLVEQQHSVRVWVPDDRFGCNAICASTGWNGWDFAMEELYQDLTKDLIPIVYEDWKRWKESPETTLFPVRNTIIPPAKWKLTDQGEISKRDLLGLDRSRVMHFWERIYHRGRFASECYYPGSGRVIQSMNDAAEQVATLPATGTITADIVEEIRASLLQELRIEIAASLTASPAIDWTHAVMQSVAIGWFPAMAVYQKRSRGKDNAWKRMTDDLVRLGLAEKIPNTKKWKFHRGAFQRLGLKIPAGCGITAN